MQEIGENTKKINFFKSQYYGVNARLLTLVGQWPRHHGVWKRFQQFIILTNMLSVMGTQMIRFVEEWGNIDMMIECFTPTGAKLLAVTKSINVMINHDKITKLLNQLENDWTQLSDDREVEILQKHANSGRKLSVIYAWTLLTSLVIFVTIPLLPQILDVIMPLNESRPTRTLLQTEYFVDPDKYYWSIVAHTYGSTFWTVTCIVAIDAMYFVWVEHACGLLSIVSYRLEKTMDTLNLPALELDPPIEDDAFYEELCICVKRHQAAIDFAVFIEATYSNAYLIQLGTIMALMSITLLQLLTKFGQYEELWRIIQFMVGQVTHLFFNSWPGQLLVNASVSTSESIYYAGWYGFSFRGRSLIQIMMMRAAKPLKITASGLYEMSMENFGAVVQTSVSYFTVLASLR